MAEYRKKNKERINNQHSEYMVSYREANRDSINDYSRSYQRRRLNIDPSRFRGKQSGRLIKECGGDMRLYNTLYRYGLTKEEYDSLPKYCEVCGSTTNLCVDHDHKTGVVRGTLCTRCNSALGLLRDNPVYIDKLKEYLTNSLSTE